MNTSAELKVDGVTYNPNAYYNDNGTCRLVQRKVVNHLNSADDRRTKTVIEFSGAYFGTSIIAKTKYFKKKLMGNGKNTLANYELRLVEEYIIIIAPIIRYLRVTLNLLKEKEDLYQKDFSL
jgi:hypothetical protein